VSKARGLTGLLAAGVLSPAAKFAAKLYVADDVAALAVAVIQVVPQARIAGEAAMRRGRTTKAKIVPVKKLFIDDLPFPRGVIRTLHGCGATEHHNQTLWVESGDQTDQAHRFPP
jgi:hypothetical protein